MQEAAHCDCPQGPLRLRPGQLLQAALPSRTRKEPGVQLLPRVSAPRGTCSTLCLAVGLGPLLAYQEARLQPWLLHCGPAPFPSFHLCGAVQDPWGIWRGQANFSFGCSLPPTPRASQSLSAPPLAVPLASHGLQGTAWHSHCGSLAQQP